MVEQRIYMEQNWGLFLGSLTDNQLHKHYAIQLSFSSQQNVHITNEDGMVNSYTNCIVQCDILHQLVSDTTVLILLINPISRIGYSLFSATSSASISELGLSYMPLKYLFDEYLSMQISFELLVIRISNFLHQSAEETVLFQDERVSKAITYMEQNFDRVLSIKEVAAHCYLSETRLQHLFKEKTNVTFRRYQLWNKLIKSFSTLGKQSITETAHQFGFTDSAHYTKAFKATFGVNPKFLTKKK